MNRQTWEVLKQKGITPRSQIRLDFSFNAPSRDTADAMETFIREETDYDVQVDSTGSILGRQWRVEGTTQETAVSQEILDQWSLGWLWPVRNWIVTLMAGVHQSEAPTSALS